MYEIKKLTSLPSKRKELRYQEKKSLLISDNGSRYPVVEYAIHKQGERPQCRMNIVINENVYNGGLDTVNKIVERVQNGESFVSICNDLGYTTDYELDAGPFW